MKQLTLLIPLILGLLSSSMANADHDHLLLKAQATIYPKIVMLDKDIEAKIKEDTIVIAIVTEKGGHDSAIAMKNLIDQEYKSNLGKKNLIIKTQFFEGFDNEDPATAYVLIGGDADDHYKVTQYASTHNRVAFSYDYKDIKNNFLVSLFVKEKTYIYLNKKALDDYDIKFLPLFYKIVKVLE
jgi:hypothetical protein